MAIESRGNGQYYYRKKRIGDKVRSEYIGAGYGAELVAQLDEHERQQAEQKRQAWQAIKDEQARLDATVNDVSAVVDAYVTAFLLAVGYHTHKRQWRKYRHDKHKANDR